MDHKAIEPELPKKCNFQAGNQKSWYYSCHVKSTGSRLKKNRRSSMSASSVCRVKEFLHCPFFALLSPSTLNEAHLSLGSALFSLLIPMLNSCSIVWPNIWPRTQSNWYLMLVTEADLRTREIIKDKEIHCARWKWLSIKKDKAIFNI